MNRPAVPLVRGVYGLVRMCLRPRALQAFLNALETEPLPLSAVTCRTWMPGRS